MPETYGEPVAFEPHTPPNHVAHLNRAQANTLVDYVLTDARPVTFPAAGAVAAALLWVLAVGAVVGATLALQHNPGDEVTQVSSIGFVAAAGALFALGLQKVSAARHGRRNHHVVTVIAAYERRLIEAEVGGREET